MVDRVERGESLIVTRDGKPVAELRPVPGKPLSSRELLRRWSHGPPVDYEAFRRDVDEWFDTSL